jgi:hypothetical protein
LQVRCCGDVARCGVGDGAKKYLASYVVGQNDTGVAPAATAPMEPSDDVKRAEPATGATKTSFGTHNRSKMYMTDEGTRRQIYYEDQSSKGTLLFDGVVDGKSISGIAYSFASGCDPLSFAVKGKLTRDGKRNYAYWQSSPGWYAMQDCGRSCLRVEAVYRDGTKSKASGYCKRYCETSSHRTSSLCWLVDAAHCGRPSKIKTLAANMERWEERPLASKHEKTGTVRCRVLERSSLRVRNAI